MEVASLLKRSVSVGKVYQNLQQRLRFLCDLQFHADIVFSHFLLSVQLHTEDCGNWVSCAAMSLASAKRLTIFANIQSFVLPSYSMDALTNDAFNPVHI